MLTTPLTRMLDIRWPIVQAAMGGVANADLAAAVSNAGGLGTLAMIGMSPDVIRRQVRRARELTSQPFAVNLVPALVPPTGLESQLAVCIDERLPVISFFWCDPAEYVPACHAAGLKVMLQVGSVEEAQRAQAGGVDVIVAQGVEAGGHVRGEIGLFPLLPTIVRAVAPTPVLGAGGIVDGRGLAAALCLGAAGVLVGTRFLASRESEAHPDYKQRVLDATSTDTVLCETFNADWPDSPHRVIRNEITDGRLKPVAPFARLVRNGRSFDVPLLSAMTPSRHVEGRTDLMANYAGQGVAMIEDIPAASDIVKSMAVEAEDTIGQLARSRD